MTSTSSERGQRTVLRDLPAGSVASAHTDLDLRDGLWTRIGAGSVLGDAATEGTLLGLAESSRAAGRAQGFAAGWAEGLRASVARTAATQQAQERVLEQHAATFLTAQRSALAAVET
ncbi:MAG: hypothetical protein WB441_16465, partial [Nocardioidaceae bacterium]